MPRLQYNKGIPYPKNEETWEKKGRGHAHKWTNAYLK